jgi:PAS domain-containing protein
MKKEKNKKKRITVDQRRYPGVYQYELEKRYKGRKDKVYAITFKDPGNGKKIWEKIGARSEGITPRLCAEIRSERVRTVREAAVAKKYGDLHIYRERFNRGDPRDILKFQMIQYFQSESLGDDGGPMDAQQRDEIFTFIEYYKNKHMAEQNTGTRTAFSNMEILGDSIDVHTGDKKQSGELLEHAFDVIYQLNLKTNRFEYVTPSSRRQWSISPEDMLTRDPAWIGRRVLHRDDWEKVSRHFENSRNDPLKEDNRTIEYRVKVERHKAYTWLSHTHSFIVDEYGSPVAMVGIVRNVDDRKEAEKKWKNLLISSNYK